MKLKSLKAKANITMENWNLSEKLEINTHGEKQKNFEQWKSIN